MSISRCRVIIPLLSVIATVFAVSANAQATNYAALIQCQIDKTTDESSLPDLTWLQGSTPLLELRAIRNGRSVVADTDTKCRIVFGATLTNSSYAVATNYWPATNSASYYVQLGIVGTNTETTNGVLTNWTYTVFFDRATDGTTYWSGSGRLYIIKSTVLGDGLTWISATNLARVAWQNVDGNVTDNQSLVDYIGASAGADETARASVVAVGAVATNAALGVIAVGAVASNAVPYVGATTNVDLNDNALLGISRIQFTGSHADMLGAAFGVSSGGYASASFGKYNIASNYGAVFGVNNVAGQYSLASGSASTAYYFSLAAGSSLYAGKYAQAFGLESRAGDYSCAIGTKAYATNVGCFVFSAYPAEEFASTNDGSFNVNAPGGIRLFGPIELSGTNQLAALELSGTGDATAKRNWDFRSANVTGLVSEIQSGQISTNVSASYMTGSTGLALDAASNLVVSGATYAYTASPATPYTLGVAATAPAKTYQLWIYSTNAMTLTNGYELTAAWSATGTNLVVLTPTGTVYRVTGKGF